MPRLKLTGTKGRPSLAEHIEQRRAAMPTRPGGFRHGTFIDRLPLYLELTGKTALLRPDPADPERILAQFDDLDLAPFCYGWQSFELRAFTLDPLDPDKPLHK